MSLMSALKKQAPAEDGIELSKQTKPVATGAPDGILKGSNHVEAPRVHQGGEERLIDLGDDVEKGGAANPDGVSSLATPPPEAEAGSATVVATGGGKKKKPGFLAMFNRDNRGALIIFGLSVVTVMAIAAVVALSIVSSKGMSFS